MRRSRGNHRLNFVLQKSPVVMNSYEHRAVHKLYGTGTLSSSVTPRRCSRFEPISAL